MPASQLQERGQMGSPEVLPNASHSKIPRPCWSTGAPLPRGLGAWPLALGGAAGPTPLPWGGLRSQLPRRRWEEASGEDSSKGLAGMRMASPSGPPLRASMLSRSGDSAPEPRMRGKRTRLMVEVRWSSAWLR